MPVAQEPLIALTYNNVDGSLNQYINAGIILFKLYLNQFVSNSRHFYKDPTSVSKMQLFFQCWTGAEAHTYFADYY